MSMSIYSFSNISSDVRFEFQTKKIESTVIFKEKVMKRPQIIEDIRTLENSKVLFWYLGPTGEISVKGAETYRRYLTGIQNMKSNAEGILYDLSAWGAFFDKTKSIDSLGRNVKIINEFALKRIRSIGSNGFFSWLQERNETTETGGYLKNRVLERSFIYQRSKDEKESGITVQDLFKGECSLVEKLYQKDCMKCYSAFQYLEGLYLIAEMAKRSLDEGVKGEINICIIVPEGEKEYYIDSEKSFEKDVNQILNMEFKEDLKPMMVKVIFYWFTYDKRCSKARPYWLRDKGDGTDSEKKISILTKKDLIG